MFFSCEVRDSNPRFPGNEPDEMAASLTRLLNMYYFRTIPNYAGKNWSLFSSGGVASGVAGAALASGAGGIVPSA